LIQGGNIEFAAQPFDEKKIRLPDNRNTPNERGYKHKAYSYSLDLESAITQEKRTVRWRIDPKDPSKVNFSDLIRKFSITKTKVLK